MGLYMGFYGEIDVRPSAMGALCMKTYMLAEWQNHYALHELICREFDEDYNSHSVKIYLSYDDLNALIEKIQNGALIYSRERMGLNVHTKDGDVEQINFVKCWINTTTTEERSVYYEAGK